MFLLCCKAWLKSMQGKKTTRQSFMDCPLGTSCELSNTVLPTYNYMPICFFHLRKPIQDNILQDISVKSIANAVNEEFKNYEIVFNFKFRTKGDADCHKFHGSYRKLMKPYKGRKTDKNYQNTINIFHQVATNSLTYICM